MSKTLKSYRFDPRTLEEIERLKEKLHLDNNSHVLRKAIALLKVATDASEGGGSIVIRSADGDKEIILC